MLSTLYPIILRIKTGALGLLREGAIYSDQGWIALKWFSEHEGIKERQKEKEKREGGTK